MALSSYIEELHKKHKLLSKEVETEQRKPAPDTLTIAQMKKKKLMLKEEIERLNTSIH